MRGGKSHHELGGRPGLRGFSLMLVHFSHFFALVPDFCDFLARLKSSSVFSFGPVNSMIDPKYSSKDDGSDSNPKP